MGMRVPYRSRLAGEQLGGWQPRGPLRRFEVRAEPDVAVVLPDGVTLRADVYRPVIEEPVPGLLGWSPYNKDLMPTGMPAPFVEPGAVAYLASRGYAVAVANARGTGRSGGHLGAVMFDEVERADLVETIGWLAARPWCDGQVGMTGMSYFAISQLVAAGERPPALRAIFPFGASTDLDRHGITQNGTLQSGFLGRYTAINGAAQRLRLAPSARHALGYLLGAPAVQRVVRSVMRRMIPTLVRHAPAPEPWMRRWAEYALAAPADRAGGRHPVPALEDIDVPVLIGSEWSMVGIHLFGAFDAWHRITAPKKLLVGPRWPDWPWLRYQDELIAFYDHVLRGDDNGYAELAAVRYWLHGAERWETATDWPPPDRRAWTLRLSGDRLGPQAGHDERSWAAIPVGMEHPGAFDRYEPQVLRYEGDPMPHGVHLAGPAELVLPLRSTALDTHVQARLSVLTGRRRVQVLAVGWLSAAHRQVDEARSTPSEISHRLDAPAALVPGRTEVLRFSLTPFAQQLDPGDRLRLELGSDPRLLAPSDDFVSFEVAGPPYAARNTVRHQGAELRLSVRPDLP
jgi:predicted acyl esterase